MLTAAETEQGYSALWDKADIRLEKKTAANVMAQRVLGRKSVLMEVQIATGVPWQWTGAIWAREADLNAHGAFANGDGIIGTGKKTWDVPRGRGPFQTWQESAIDEIKRRELHKITNWSIEMMLFQAEAFNGWGYLGKCNSPYDWAYTLAYGPPQSKGGKYIRDGVFSYSAIDSQCGVAAIWKALAILDPQTDTLIGNRQTISPKEIIDNETKKATTKTRNIAKGAGGAATAGGASEATKQATTTHVGFVPSPVALFAIGAGITVLVIALVLTIRTGNLLKARW